jgi:hypothetical protein
MESARVNIMAKLNEIIVNQEKKTVCIYENN